MICSGFLVFARRFDHIFRKMTVSAENNIKAEEQHTVVAIQKVNIFLETPERCIPLTFIAE
jgi:hypothetical protein